MSPRELMLTVSDIESMPEDGNRYEVISGELHVSTSPSRLHQSFLMELSFRLRLYLETNKIGEVLAGIGVIFDEFNGVIPDLVFYTNERKRTIASVQLSGAPELVVEVVSQGSRNEQRDRNVKRVLYSENGVSEYWIADPEAKMIEVYRSLRTGGFGGKTVLREKDLLTTPLLPGFECEVGLLFPEYTGCVTDAPQSGRC
ncbi:MAG: Uma2 family endonuclease [Acidobacteria bacterium]|nr:Uma2 family endonuclease [Acidobacteriota bacterium]